MKNLKVFLGTAFAVAMFVPGLAAASTSNTFMTFPNSGPNVTTSIGSSVQVKDTIKLTSGSELESISHQLVDNMGNDIGMPEVCDDIADRVVSGTYTVLSDFDLTGGTEGTFGIRTRAYGVTGPGTDNNCGGTVNDNQYYSARVTITEDQNTGTNANNTGGNSNGGNTGGSSDTQTILEKLIAQASCVFGGGSWNGVSCFHAPTTTPPVVPTGNEAKCATARPFLSAQPYAYSNTGIQLQSALLLDDPMSIPLLAAGSSIRQGFFGVQTHQALTNYSSKYGCNFIFN